MNTISIGAYQILTVTAKQSPTENPQQTQKTYLPKACFNQGALAAYFSIGRNKNR